MLSFPNIKINLGLNITEKREDGYHNLESCFYPVMWQDALEIIESDSLKMEITGIAIPGTVKSNLCMKAYNLLSKDFEISPVHIHLHKAIPTGTGLGGGSGNASFMLKLLNDFFELNLKKEQLAAYALQLGSDCPFFVHNSPAIAKGRGEELENLEGFLKGKYIQIVCPGVHISTAEAYKNITPKKIETPTKEILAKPIEEWKEKLVNDFEAWAIQQHPIIGDIKNRMYKQGAKYTAMSGSGSAIFGIYDAEATPLTFEDAAVVVWNGVL